MRRDRAPEVRAVADRLLAAIPDVSIPVGITAMIEASVRLLRAQYGCSAAVACDHLRHAVEIIQKAERLS